MSIWSRIERQLTNLADEILPDEFREQIAEARALLAEGRAAEAAASLEALVGERPEHSGAQALLGAALLEMGDAPRAQLAFERAIAADTDSPEGHLGRGDACAAQGDDATAIDAYRTAVSRASGDRAVLHEAYRGLGLAYRRAGEVGKAIRELRKAVAESPRDGLALGGLGEALLANPEVPDDEAARWLHRASDCEPVAAITWLGLGILALRTGGDDAREHFDRALSDIAADPAWRTTPMVSLRRRALVGIGDAALAAGDAAEANRFFLQALEIDPRDAEVHARIGDVHRAVGNLDAALPSYERALDLGAEHAVLERALDTALEARATEPAVRLANQVLARDPEATRALVARGIALANDGQHQAARATFKAALSRADDALAHVALGELELAASPTRAAGDAAAAAALSALRIAPRDRRARALLADARARSFDTGNAPASEPDAALYRAVARLGDLALHARELGDLAADATRAASDFDQPLLVTVMGEFSSGKSTFVNAFIGADVAPTGITPTTATINVVKYGRERGGRIVRRDGSVDNLAWEPLLAALRGLGADAAREIRTVEILVPLEELERINIVDTPGLNSILPEHEEVARNFIARADAVVWLFTANQAGKKSEKQALERIRDEGVRVLGVLNKVDQLEARDLEQVMSYVHSELEGLVEAVVPLSARKTLAWRDDGALDDGNWSQLEAALERRFFARAREIKRDVCGRRLGVLVERGRLALVAQRERASAVADALAAAADKAADAATDFAGTVALTQRRDLTADTAELYRRAASEVLELVQPRRLPFGSHSATEADRDYLVSLLQSGYEAALERSRRSVVAALRAAGAAAIAAAAEAAPVVGAEAIADIGRTIDDALRLVEARVFARCRAYLAGYLRGGFVDRFFARDLPRIELSRDAIYHALFRDSPDLDAQIGAPMTEAGAGAIADLGDRLRHWAGVAEVMAYDMEVGVQRALDEVAAAADAARDRQGDA